MLSKEEHATIKYLLDKDYPVSYISRQTKRSTTIICGIIKNPPQPAAAAYDSAVMDRQTNTRSDSEMTNAQIDRPRSQPRTTGQRNKRSGTISGDTLSYGNGEPLAMKETPSHSDIQEKRVLSLKDFAARIGATENLATSVARRCGVGLFVDAEAADQLPDQLAQALAVIREPFVKAGKRRVESLSPEEHKALGRHGVSVREERKKKSRPA